MNTPEATERDIFQTIHDYIYVAAVLAGVTPDPKILESVMMEIIERLDPFFIAFPDEVKGFYPYLAQMAHDAMTTFAESKARAAVEMSQCSTP